MLVWFSGMTLMVLVVKLAMPHRGMVKLLSAYKLKLRADKTLT
jgi:hypothetical protein